MRVEGFPGDSASKESTCNVGDLGSIPGLERSPGEGNSYPLRYSGLENSMDCSPPGSSVHGISRQEYWSGLTFPSPGNLLDPGIEPESPALQAGSLLTELPGKPGYELKADLIYFRMKVKEEDEKAG